MDPIAKMLETLSGYVNSKLNEMHKAIADRPGWDDPSRARFEEIVKETTDLVGVLSRELAIRGK